MLFRSHANPYGELVELVCIRGEDEEDILEQLDHYLEHRKQNCYAQEIEEN